MKKFLSCFVAMMLIVALGVEGQVVDNANDFLELGGFAASQSLGNSDIALVKGSEAAILDPSGLVDGGAELDFAVLHNRYMSGMATQNIVSAAYRTDSLTAFGASLLRVGVDDIQNTLHLFDSDGQIDYSRISYFSVADYALFLSVGRRLERLQGLSVGANVKLIYRHEGDFANAYGFGVDIGARYMKGRLSCAAVLYDAATTFDFWSVDASEFDSSYIVTGNSIPVSRLEQRSPSIAFSSAYVFGNEVFRTTVTASLRTCFGYNTSYVVHSDFASVAPSAGVELSFRDVVSLRGGISDFQYDDLRSISHKASARPSVGAGLRLHGFRTDYAFFFSGAMGAGSNVFTVGWGR